MSNTDRMCGVTCFYNLSQSKERLRNFATFRARWEKSGLPLLVIEWSPWGEFQLGDEPSDLIKYHQISGGAICWQKERLFNIAAEIMMSFNYDKIVYVDSDVLFPEDDFWVGQLAYELETHDVVQCFENVVCEYGDVTRAGPSTMSQYEKEGNILSSSPGGVWAFNKRFAEGAGWYENNMVGGGDSTMVHALLNDVPEYENSKTNLTPRNCPDSQWDHFVNWHRKVKRLDPKITYLKDVDIVSMQHGSNKGRKFQTRVFYNTGYSPDDHSFSNPGRPIQWQAQCPEILKNNLTRYFFERGYDEAYYDSINDHVKETITTIP